MRALCVLLSVFVFVPGLAKAQSVSVQAAAGPTLVDTGYNLSAAAGFSPASRVTFLLDVQRTHLFSRSASNERGSGAFRGGTMTAVSGELRLALRPPDRVSPYVLGGLGAGVSRPTVNETFPDPVTNDARFAFVGAGVQVPLRGGVSLFGDARLLIGAEGDEGILAIWPLRAGLAWRF